MLAALRSLAPLLAILAQAVVGWAAEPAAFVTEVEGRVRIVHADGSSADAAVGGQLATGDALVIQEGRAVLIYLSGRSTEVTQGETLTVGPVTAPEAPLMGRIRQTLEEIVGPREAAQGPVVQGMARQLPGIPGAEPANTRVLSPDFAFSWRGLEGVQEYRFTVDSDAGRSVAEQVLADTAVPAAALGLATGRRYVWKAEETESLLPRSTGRCWVVVAPDSEAVALRQVLSDLDQRHGAATAVLLK
ncbi:MAG: hypothetical protein AB1505_28585, partial [Candidatus Latescibacterota bacterium]